MKRSIALRRHGRQAAGYSLLEIMLVVGLTGIVSAIAVPMVANSLGKLRLDGDARGVASAASLAKLRAAANFTKTRLFVDVSESAFHTETWQNGTWVADAGNYYLSNRQETFSWGAVLTPPSNTQSSIGQSQCLTAAGEAISNTACVVFNSRGIPVTDAVAGTGSPTNSYAVYVTDSVSVFSVTVSSTGNIQTWRSNNVATPAWTLQ